MSVGRWTKAALADVLTVRREPVPVSKDAQYANLGLYSFGRGAFVKPAIEGTKTSATTLYRVRAGQFIYSRLFAFEGAFAEVPEPMDGWYVSNEYPTFDVDGDRTSAEFIHMALSRPSIWSQIASRTIGMGHRRQRLQPVALLSFELELPPLDEQREIVRAVNVADAAIVSTATEAAAAAGLLAALQTSLFAGGQLGVVRDVLSKIEAGKSPKCPDRPVEPGEPAVLKVSAIRAGEFRPAEAKPIPDGFLFPDHAQVRQGDVLISRANTRALVGAACTVDADCENLFLCDKTLRLVPHADKVDSRFLVHALASREARAHLESSARGSSDSMKNISQADIYATPIPLPPLPEQQAIAAKLEAVRAALHEAYRAHAATVALRRELLEDLVAGSRRLASARDLVPT